MKLTVSPKQTYRCHHCGAAAGVRETRVFRRTMIRRVRVCELGHSFSTYEVPLHMLREGAYR